MHERPLIGEDEYYKDARLILSTIALVNAGAEFENGQLMVPSEHIEQLVQENPASKQAIPSLLHAPAHDSFLYTHAPNLIPEALEEKILTAKKMLRSAYRLKRLEQAAEHLDPTQPTAYLQTIRDFLLQNDHDKRQSDEYQLEDPNVTHPILLDPAVGDDISRILPHRKIQLYSTGWIDMNDEKARQRPPAQSYVIEQGFINHAVSLYSITERMANYTTDCGLPPLNPPVSMRSLPEHQRHVILQTVYTEWEEFVPKLPPAMHTYILNNKRPLLFRAAHELRTAYEQYPQLTPASIALTFVNSPLAFDRVLTRYTAKDTPKVAASKHQRPSLTQRELGWRKHAKTVLAQSSPYKFSENLTPGEIIYPEKVESLDDVVFSALARLYAKANQHYGMATGNVWHSKTIDVSINEKINPKRFYGKLESPRVVIVPVDEAFIGRYFSKLQNTEDIDRESVVRLNAIVDMRSTGRGVIGQSAVDIVLYTRHLQDTARRRHILSIRGVASGEKLPEYLRDESNAVAQTVLQYAVANPLLSGLGRPK